MLATAARSASRRHWRGFREVPLVSSRPLACFTSGCDILVISEPNPVPTRGPHAVRPVSGPGRAAVAGLRRQRHRRIARPVAYRAGLAERGPHRADRTRLRHRIAPGGGHPARLRGGREKLASARPWRRGCRRPGRGRSWRALEWTPARVDALAHAIETHSFSAGLVPRNDRGEILQDADRLDAIGAIGIARCFHVGGRMGGALYHPDEPAPKARPLNDRAYALDHFPAKLFKVADGFLTAEGRRMAAARTC